MPTGVLEMILDDAERFMKKEQWYVERGIPYRRGYLLHGPPGNGKSSAVMALASKLKLDICVLSLSGGGMGDDELRRLLSDLPSDSAIVLIEDVDCVFQQRESSDDKDSKITFSGLLNAIDGVVAAEGRILVMTTNFPDKLDAALIRPGRCDVQVLVKNADEDQARRLFLRFFGGQETLAREFGVLAGTGNMSMAKLQGHLLKYAEHNPQDAITNFTELLNEPQTADEGSERATGELGLQADKAGGPDAGPERVHQDSVA
jgi:chaperone BCS1